MRGVRLEVAMLLEHALLVDWVADLHHQPLLGVEVRDRHIHHFV